MGTAAASGVQVTAIMNPATGPGNTSDPNYVREVNALRAKGGKVLGYIPSSYAGGNLPATDSTCRPGSGRARYAAQDLVDCARRYQTLYTVDGIFVDEMGTTGGITTPAGIAFYQQIYDGLKAINPAWLIIGNPGTPGLDRGYMRSGASGGADVLVTFESPATAYRTSATPSYSFDFAATRFANLVYSAGTGLDFATALALARSRNVSYFYFTDRNANWDGLPSDWEAQVTTVRTTNPR